MAWATVRRYLDPRAEQLLPVQTGVLMLDRDGVLNIDDGYVHRAEDTRWVDGAFEALVRAHESGWRCIVVTNQAGIARGYYTEAEFLAYTAWLHEEFARRGCPLLATFYCPHHPTAGSGVWLRSCCCRKPAAGMPSAALDAFDVDPARVIFVGDKPSDRAAARAAGIARFVPADGARFPPVDFHGPFPVVPVGSCGTS